jgi:hypothetical protein
MRSGEGDQLCGRLEDCRELRDDVVYVFSEQVDVFADIPHWLDAVAFDVLELAAEVVQPTGEKDESEFGLGHGAEASQETDRFDECGEFDRFAQQSKQLC